MRFSTKLFFGPMALLQGKNIIKSIKHKKPVIGIFIIAVSESADNLLDIYDALSLLQPHMKKNKQKIVGIAVGKDEATELVRTIIDKIYTETGSVDVKKYFA